MTLKNKLKLQDATIKNLIQTKLKSIDWTPWDWLNAYQFLIIDDKNESKDLLRHTVLLLTI